MKTRLVPRNFSGKNELVGASNREQVKTISNNRPHNALVSTLTKIY